jgi:hypothetical protein
MNRILRPFLNIFVIIYLNNIFIFFDTKDEYAEYLAKILEILQTNALFYKPAKCIFAVPQLEFYGYLISEEIVKSLTSKVAIIRNWPKPTNVYKVRQFLNIASYYRRYIRNFAVITIPIFDLLKEGNAEVRKKKYRTII